MLLKGMSGIDSVEIHHSIYYVVSPLLQLTEKKIQSPGKITKVCFFMPIYLSHLNNPSCVCYIFAFRIVIFDQGINIYIYDDSEVNYEASITP